jgi:hypothetical protein
MIKIQNIIRDNWNSLSDCEKTESNQWQFGQSKIQHFPPCNSFNLFAFLMLR